MDSFVVERVVAIAALVLGAAFFAGAETAMFSLTRVSREAMATRGDAGSKRVLWLLSNPRRLIVTLIVCNELINILASSLSANLTEHLLPHMKETWQVIISTAAVVPLLLLIGELAPKSMAVRVGEPWARAVAAPLEVVMLVITPVRLILSAVAGAILTVVGGKQAAQELGMREEEFRALVDVGSEVGELQVAERRLIHNVFEFGDTTVGKVMTPADKVFALPYEMPLGRLVEAVSAQRFSRVPIYKARKGARKGTAGELGPSGVAGGAERSGKLGPSGVAGGAERSGKMEVEGVLLAKDLVGYARGQLEGHTIQDLLHPPLFVPRTTKCDRLFREFQRRKTHIALVVDEYGRLSGLVTMEDLLEELFGEIADEKESRA